LGKSDGDKRILLGCYADGKALATFRPSPLDHQPAVFGGHAYEETVGSFSGDVARLESSFHLYLLLKRNDNFSFKGKYRT
jgi:hypothetical protein